MAKERNDGSSSRPLNKSVIYEAIYQTKIITPEGFGNLREGYLKWGSKIYGNADDRYFWYRDGSNIYKIAAIEANYANYFLWKNTDPTDPDFPQNKPLPSSGTPTGTGWTQLPGPDPNTDSLLTSTTPHNLAIGDKVTVTSPTDGKAITSVVTNVNSPTQVTVSIPDALLTGWTDYAVYPTKDHTGYMTYIYNGILYIRYWDPTIQNPDGSFGAYRTDLPKASILDQKIEFIPDSEIEVPNPALPEPSIKPAIYYRHIPAQQGTNANGEPIYKILNNTILTIHSAIRYNSHILRPATQLSSVGIDGEYYWENDVPAAGQASISIARKPQVGDFITTMF